MGWTRWLLYTGNHKGIVEVDVLMPTPKANVVQAHLPAPAKDIKLLMCGPPPMISAMKKATDSLGYEKPRPVSKLQDQVFCF